MKIIQIRGSNGAGKTTIVREYIERNGFEPISVKVGGSEIECSKVGSTIIIGRYDRNECGGCDACVKSGDELKNTIAKIARELRPEAIVFEGFIYSVSFDFTYQIYKHAKRIGAEFVAICLEPPFETTLERIYSRNGGKEINIEGRERNYLRGIISNDKLAKAKVDLLRVDTSKIERGKMWSLLEDIATSQ